MIVLDTNVLSELTRPAPDPAVVRWLDAQPELFTTATVLAELVYGVTRLPAGRRRDLLEREIGELAEGGLAGRILPFDEHAAREYGAVVAARESRGMPISQADAQIAAVCLSTGAALATRNTGDFRELPLTLINPWEAR
ncbi:type II toxin-antitoxin system VapC family toxin [soil metagenome]